jgi:hypothetical protein
METAPPRKPSSPKVGERRARVSGSARAFLAEARRQSLAVATSASEADDQAFIDAISALDFGRDGVRRPRGDG